jgi:hypothetical protein
MGGSKWIKFILMSGVVIGWQLYDFSTVTEAQPQTLLIMQYGLLALASFSFVGSVAMLVKERREGA